MCEPGNEEQLIRHVSECYCHLDFIRKKLHDNVWNIKKMADEVFGEIRYL